MRDDDRVTIGVLGLGHVGLPTALGFAELGWPVVGADDDREKSEHLARGESTFYEPGLEEMLRKHLDSGGFRVGRDVPSTVQESKVLFVCVGTPQGEDGAPDLSQVEQVTGVIGRHLNGYKLIVEKSTTPVRTAEQLFRSISRYSNGDHAFDVAVNPEFLREGTALSDFLNPDRIVLGVESDRARDLLLQIYGPLWERNPSGKSDAFSGYSSQAPIEGDDCSSNRRIVITDLNTAEIIKHAANAFLATKVSFINMVADLCDEAGADVNEVARGLGMDPRIGPHYLGAGVGFGGYCFPKDLRAFTRIGEDHNVDMTLLKAVSDINDRRTERFVSTLRRALWVLNGKVLAIWGLAFKPQTDDVREAPSLRIVERLLSEGACLRLHDPRAMHEFQKHYPEEADRLTYFDSPLEAAKGTDALLLITEWPEFREVDLASVRAEMSMPVIVDGRNFLDSARVKQLGFEYYGMGR